jgi:LysM repeat protein
MKDDSELQMDDADDSTYLPKRRRIGAGNSKSLRILLGVILVLIFVGGIFYFLGKRPTGGEASPLQLKVTTLEQKIAGLEKQLAELQGKGSTSGPDPALIHRVDALAQKVEALEKRKQPTAESKIKPSPSSKRAVSTEKRYHTVQKGETLSGISLEELRKQNTLSTDQPLRTGQKLLVSRRR